MPSEHNLEEARQSIFSVPSSFQQANGKIRKVESDWHYPTLTAAGFVPETKEAVGLVRAYVYNHPDGRSVTYHHGANADYWRSNDGQGGYWSSLQKYLDQ